MPDSACIIGRPARTIVPSWRVNSSRSVAFSVPRPFILSSSEPCEAACACALIFTGTMPAPIIHCTTACAFGDSIRPFTSSPWRLRPS